MRDWQAAQGISAGDHRIQALPGGGDTGRARCGFRSGIYVGPQLLRGSATAALMQCSPARSVLQIYRSTSHDDTLHGGFAAGVPQKRDRGPGPAVRRPDKDASYRQGRAAFPHGPGSSRIKPPSAAGLDALQISSNSMRATAQSKGCGDRRSFQRAGPRWLRPPIYLDETCKRVHRHRN